MAPTTNIKYIHYNKGKLLLVVCATELRVLKIHLIQSYNLVQVA